MKQTPLIGHIQSLSALTNLYSQGKLPHGILLAGTRSTGKRKLAIELARKILNVETGMTATENANQNDLINQGVHPDLHFVYPEDGKKGISVDQIRDLKEKFSLKPYYGKACLALINDAHKMNLAASNSLLKLLEEPEQNKYLILITDCPQLLPDTILSRSQIFNCSPLSNNQVDNILQELLEPPLPNEIIAPLSQYASGSLSIFNLDTFVDKKTFEIKDPEQCRKYLEDFSNTLESLKKRIRKILAIPHNSDGYASQVIQLCSSMEKGPLLNIFWDILILEVREKMISSRDQRAESTPPQNPLPDSHHWAETLLRLCETKKEIEMRNLNFGIQVTNSMIQDSTIAY